MLKHQLLIIALALGSAGCARTITKSDCETADYYELGLKDGKSGESTERLQEYRSSCAGHGVAIQEDRYNYGRRVGLTEYCDESRGKKDAKKGEATSVCTAEKVPPYMTGFMSEIDEVREEKMKELEKIQASKQELQEEENKIRSELDTINSQAAPM